MNVLDVFNSDAFRAVHMTEAVNLVPNDYGRIRDLGLFTEEPIPLTTVFVTYSQGTLNLLPTRERGGPPSLGMPEKRHGRTFSAFHIPHEDFVLADEVQNVLARMGDSNAALEQVEAVVNRKLLLMRRKHSITLEHMRVTALRGIVRDYDGTALLDLYNEFGISQQSVDFVLGTDTTNVKSKIQQDVVGYIEDNLNGETMTGVHAFASPTFFDRLTSHPKVEEVFRYYNPEGSPNPTSMDVRRRFPFHGIVFEEYRGAASYLAEDGTYVAQKFIPDGEAIAFPIGTTDTFSTYFAPADFVDTVNTMGEQVYARSERMKFDRGVEIHTQSNPLPINKRPQLAVRLHSSN